MRRLALQQGQQLLQEAGAVTAARGVRREMPRVQSNHVSSSRLTRRPASLLETGQAQLAACVVNSLHNSRTVIVATRSESR